MKHNDNNIGLLDKISKKVILVLLPGIFNTSTFYKALFIPYFSRKGYECHPIDLLYRDRAFNQTPYPKLGERTIQDDAAELSERIQVLAQKDTEAKIVLVGHSRGALLAQMVAEKLDGYVGALVLLNPAVPYGINSFSLSGLKTFLCLLKYGKFWRKPVARSLHSLRYGVLDKDVTEQEAREIYKTQVWESGRIIWQLAFKKPKIDASKIKCPVLIVGGTRDKLISTKMLEKLVDLLRADKKIMDVAHYPFRGDKGRQIIFFIDEWLRKL